MKAPHMIRYLGVALLINPTKTNEFKKFIKIIKRKYSSYRDPIVNFFENIFIKVDLEKTEKELKECLVLMKNDYFLNSYVDQFNDFAKQKIIEYYIRVHQTVDLK
jgi:translation initiation factor 3 subunit E